jgi:hypothetical protein
MQNVRSLDVLYQALSQCDLSGPCSTFHNHLLKASQAYPLVHSFKPFSLLGALLLVELVALYVVPIISSSRRRIVVRLL